MILKKICLYLFTTTCLLFQWHCSREFTPRHVEIRFVNNVYSDYRYYFFYRNGRFGVKDNLPSLEEIPTIDQLIVLPNDVASLEIQEYSEIYPLLEEYRNPKDAMIDDPVPRILTHSQSFPPYDTLVSIIRQGEPHFSAFNDFWKTNIEPKANNLIGIWEKQLEESRPLETLQRITKLRFPFKKLDVGCIALHLAGSANFSPAGVYTMIFNKKATRPDLSWMLGHEGTHLLFTEKIGTDWKAHPMAKKAIEAVESKDGDGYDIEESLCVFMQFKLSQECGHYRNEVDWPKVCPKGFANDIITSMGNTWEEYVINSEKYPTIVDFMLRCTLAATEGEEE